MKTILAAIDGSAGAERAVAFAGEIAAAAQAELLLLTVSDGLVSESIQSMAHAERITVGEMLEAEAQATLAKARQIAERQGVSQIRARAETGDAAMVILDCAQRESVGLVVVGKRGRGRLSGLVLGSVSQKLASLAPCTVAIVP